MKGFGNLAKRVKMGKEVWTDEATSGAEDAMVTRLSVTYDEQNKDPKSPLRYALMIDFRDKKDASSVTNQLQALLGYNADEFGVNNPDRYHVSLAVVSESQLVLYGRLGQAISLLLKLHQDLSSVSDVSPVLSKRAAHTLQNPEDEVELSTAITESSTAVVVTGAARGDDTADPGRFAPTAHVR